MTSEYYTRQGTTNTDGTPLHCTDHDKKHESELVSLLQEKWGCEIHQFGNLCPIDYYAQRHGRLVGVAELKSRTHPSVKYQTVYLNARKWLAMMMAQVGMGCPAVFVVRFTDEVRFIQADLIDASKLEVGGCARRVKSRTDIEPVILVPVDQMSVLAKTPTITSLAG